jgi:WD40 repeat protein
MIDDNDLTADAFENDNKEHLNKEFGRTVTSKYEVIGSGNFGLIADPQYNPLAFIKPDGTSKRTPLAASTSFLCYIVKSNMIRVINTENPQEKMLIKGHVNEIGDIKFSISGKYLCSVSLDMICLWSLREGPDPEYENVLQLPFSGGSIEPHPGVDGCFAVCDKNRTCIAIISAHFVQLLKQATSFQGACILIFT